MSEHMPPDEFAGVAAKAVSFILGDLADLQACIQGQGQLRIDKLKAAYRALYEEHEQLCSELERARSEVKHYRAEIEDLVDYL
jgi:hypothetical protein